MAQLFTIMKANITFTIALLLLKVGLIFQHFFGSQFDAGAFSFNYFAAGDFAIGIFSAGTFAIGIFSAGIFSIGIFSLGIFNIGIYSIGLFILFKRKKGHSRLQLPKTSSKRVFIFSVLSFSLLQSYAQLSNGDFEKWDSTNNYMQPIGFTSANPLSDGSFYPVTRSEDVSPTSNGKYSLRIESRSKELPSAEAFGLIMQNPQDNLISGPKPAFALKGHPIALHGSLKYFPDNSDSMLIIVQFFNNGSVVSFGQLVLADSIAEWNAFKITMSNYNEADSASILLSSYYAMGPPPAYVPQGNSIMFVDDLWLEGESASIPQNNKVSLGSKMKVYPNPCSDVLIIELDLMGIASVELIDTYGTLILSESIIESIILDVRSIPAGNYFLKTVIDKKVSYKRVTLVK